MFHPKRKRQLAFEQLDHRIAMNSDMHPFASVAYEPVPIRDFATRIEIRSVSIVTTFPAYAVVQYVVAQHPLNPSPTQHRTEPVRLRINMGMRAPAEGESSQSVSINPPSQTVLSFGTSLAVSSAALARSSPDVSRSSVDVPSLNIDAPRPEPRTQTPRAAASSPREFVAAHPTRNSSPVPLMESSPAKVGGEAGLNSSQKTVLQSQSYLALELIASTSTQSLQPKNLALTKKTDTTNSAHNGMLTFSMREAADRSAATGSSREKNHGNRFETFSDLQLVQTAEADRLRTGILGSSKKLPVPKGMIEICASDAVNSQRRSQSTVSGGANNPFEILQLFIGSTNMVQGAGGTQVSNASRMIETDSQSAESPELATKEDSILALAVGVVFAIAFRQNKKQKYLIGECKFLTS